jgi:hypothetical protein
LRYKSFCWARAAPSAGGAPSSLRASTTAIGIVRRTEYHQVNKMMICICPGSNPNCTGRYESAGHHIPLC